MGCCDSKPDPNQTMPAMDHKMPMLMEVESIRDDESVFEEIEPVPSVVSSPRKTLTPFAAETILEMVDLSTMCTGKLDFTSYPNGGIQMVKFHAKAAKGTKTAGGAALENGLAVAFL